MLDILSAIINLERNPTLVFDAHKTLIAANPAAQVAISSGDVIQIVDGRLKLVARSARATLKDYLKASDTVGRRVISIENGADTNPVEYWLVVDRIEIGSDEQLFRLSLRTPSRKFSRDESTLMQAWKLTRAEALMALALSHGETVTSFAHRTNRELTTARWHLRNILDKSGARSQADLIRRVLILCH